MTFRGWAFVLFGIIATLIYAVMGVRELWQRNRSGPQSPETDKVEGEFNRAIWPLLVGFIIALILSQPESSINAAWWVGVLALALVLSARSLIGTRAKILSVGNGSAPTAPGQVQRLLRLSLLERQAIFFGILWIVALPIYAFLLDEDGKFVGYGYYETFVDWPKLFIWALTPPSFVITATFLYERLVSRAKN